MEINDYLKTYQPSVYQTLANAFKTNTLSHAYLFIGEESTPLNQIALYIAKSKVCDNPTPFACNTCLSCMRFDEGSYTDFYLLDGENSSVKKESVLALEKAFALTSVEEKGVLLYVINKVEKMTSEATNALLKFLEEPASNVYAFLTSSSLSSVLPTIKSRTQNLNIALIKKQELLVLCKDIDVPQADLELLIPFFNLPLLIEKEYKGETYNSVKESVIMSLESFVSSPRLGYITAHKKIGALRDRTLIKRVFSYISLFLKDCINYNIGHELMFPSYTSLISGLSKCLVNPLPLIVKTYEITKKLDDNVNSGLLIDELFILLLKETQNG